ATRDIQWRGAAGDISDEEPRVTMQWRGAAGVHALSSPPMSPPRKRGPMALSQTAAGHTVAGTGLSLAPLPQHPGEADFGAAGPQRLLLALVRRPAAHPDELQRRPHPAVGIAG